MRRHEDVHAYAIRYVPGIYSANHGLAASQLEDVAKLLKTEFPEVKVNLAEHNITSTGRTRLPDAMITLPSGVFCGDGDRIFCKIKPDPKISMETSMGQLGDISGGVKSGDPIFFCTAAAGHVNGDLTEVGRYLRRLVRQQ